MACTFTTFRLQSVGLSGCRSFPADALAKGHSANMGLSEESRDAWGSGEPRAQNLVTACRSPLRRIWDSATVRRGTIRPFTSRSMRSLHLLVIFCLPLLSGCSVLIARSGSNIDSLQTQADVHAKFGTPNTLVATESGLVEEFRTRRKLANEMGGIGYGMEFCMLFGLTEPLNTLTEITWLGQTTLMGQDLRFEYDDLGAVRSRYLVEENPHNLFLRMLLFSPREVGVFFHEDPSAE